MQGNPHFLYVSAQPRFLKDSRMEKAKMDANESIIALEKPELHSSALCMYNVNTRL